MKALPLLTELQRQGVRFIAEGDRLRVLTPAGMALSDTIKHEIRRHKQEILSRVRAGGIAAEDVAVVFPGALVIEAPNDLGVCARCAGHRWWVSRYGMKVCSRCFPPSIPDVVVAWVGSKRNAA